MRALDATFLLMLFLVSSSAYILFKINHHVLVLQRDLKEVNKQIINEKENLHILKAEWSFLTRPKRLGQLAAERLQLQTVQPAQIIRYLPESLEAGGR